MLRPVMESIQEQLDVSEQLAQHGRLCEDTEKSMSLEIEKQDRILQELRDTKAALENEIHKAEQDKELDVNEFLEPRDVLSRQLLDLIAEEAALDDMILHLEDCLKEKLLPADAWMQEVRDTVRRQFYVRELKKKVIRAVRARKVKVSLATSPREDALNSMRAGTIAS
ncbi:unnamed protein product [Amoebophrya sp. A25]|nr:unnamed protein product [Amoebophrya sp. A25]|eukprot:GSA25T00013633001.1